jgi:very-short-patch-repair endonuclease
MWRRCRDACGRGWLCCPSFLPGSPGGEAPSPRPSPRKRGEGAGAAHWTSNSHGFAQARMQADPALARTAREGCCFMRGAKVAEANKARRLLRNATIAEQRLWYRLRSRSLYGMKFVRQEPIGPYIVDFVCRERRLIIEVDGRQHAESERDLVRDRWLRDHKYRILRFWNNDVIQNTDGVLEAIAEVLGAAPSPRLPSGRLRPSSTGYGEGRGEGALPQAQTAGDAPSAARGES